MPHKSSSRRYRMGPRGEEPVWASKSSTAEMGREAARTSVRNHTEPVHYGNTKYDRASAEEFHRLTGRYPAWWRENPLRNSVEKTKWTDGDTTSVRSFGNHGRIFVTRTGRYLQRYIDTPRKGGWYAIYLYDEPSGIGWGKGTTVTSLGHVGPYATREAAKVAGSKRWNKWQGPRALANPRGFKSFVVTFYPAVGQDARLRQIVTRWSGKLDRDGFKDTFKSGDDAGSAMLQAEAWGIASKLRGGG